MNVIGELAVKDMVPSNYPEVCSFFLVTLTYCLAVRPTSGSLRDANVFKQNKETDPRKYGATFRREGLNYSKEYVATAGVIARNGSIAFDSDYIEYNQTARLNCK